MQIKQSEAYLLLSKPLLTMDKKLALLTFNHFSVINKPVRLALLLTALACDPGFQ
jgi:hypothetical protein